MTDRAAELRRLAARLRERAVVNDAFLAKSFTDRLLILDVCQGEAVPDDMVQLLADHGLHGAETVYDDEDAARSFTGDVGESTRHHFVDVETRGSHQSYVVE
jgi:hypothetical protein